MEKPGGPRRRAAAFETRKAQSKLDLIKPLGGPQGGADGPPAQERRYAVPHVLRRNPLCWGISRRLSPPHWPKVSATAPKCASAAREPGIHRNPRVNGAGKRGGRFHSLCNWRLSDSTSSDSETSLVTNASILRTACRTVVWSRPPKRRPISGRERSVRVLARYIATCLGRTTLAVRREDNRSDRLTLYCRATTRWMYSILIRFGSCGRIRSRTSRSAISR